MNIPRYMYGIQHALITNNFNDILHIHAYITKENAKT